MKEQFKVGDKVKCIMSADARTKINSLVLGQIYTIKEVRYKFVYVEGQGEDVGWYPERFELVEPEFKVGDKVKCINPTCLLTLNKIYEVKRATDNSIYIERDDDFGVAEYFTDNISDVIRFVKVEESVKKTPEKTTEVVINTDNLIITVSKDVMKVNGIVISKDLIEDIYDAFEWLEG